MPKSNNDVTLSVDERHAIIEEKWTRHKLDTDAAYRRVNDARTARYETEQQRRYGMFHAGRRSPQQSTITPELTSPESASLKSTSPTSPEQKR